MRLVRYVSSLNDNELLPAPRNEATPDEKTEEKSNGNVATRFNVPLSAIPDNHDHIDEPRDGIEDINDNANCVARTIKGNIIIRTASVTVGVWVKAGTTVESGSTAATACKAVGNTCTPSVADTQA